MIPGTLKSWTTIYLKFSLQPLQTMEDVESLGRFASHFFDNLRHNSPAILGIILAGALTLKDAGVRVSSGRAI